MKELKNQCSAVQDEFKKVSNAPVPIAPLQNC